MADQRFFSVSGLVIRDNKVLLVRHTYGPAKGRLIIPGGYVQDSETADKAIEREIMEETGVKSKASGILSVRIKPGQWWIIYKMEYISGEAVSDNKENSEAVFISIDKAMEMDDVGEINKKFIRKALRADDSVLFLDEWIAKGANSDEYKLYL